ncbi:MAG: Crp/Fnr family transcriptional regulator [Eubacteriales bacterium]|nr:Crp/Fnr family transcriptional regulator [Eubacteriales bacterium]
MFFDIAYQVQDEYRKYIKNYFRDKAPLINYKKGELIEADFTSTNYCYCVADGIVRQYFIDGAGKERTVILLRPGEIFSEINMMQGNIDLVISAAFTDCSVHRIYQANFAKLFEDNPEFAYQLFMMETTKIRQFLFQIYDGSFYDVDNSLINLLSRLSVLFGVRTEAGVLLDIYLSHEDMAKMIGSSRSTVTRSINRLEEKGYIQSKNKRITILDRADNPIRTTFSM